MAPIASPVRQYMSTPLVDIGPEADLREAAARLAEHHISALAVQDPHEGLVGVVSRTDLLRAGRIERGEGGGFESLHLPDLRVADVMARSPACVDVDDPLDRAARRMVEDEIHRVVVTRSGAAVGVLSTRDVMDALVDHAVATPIAELATFSLVRVAVDDPISLAVERMAQAHKHGLIVVDEGWPVGLFAQVDALAARGESPDIPVERVMNLSILMLPGEISVARAAAQANSLRVRRVLVLRDGGAEGILSGIDFARAAL